MEADKLRQIDTRIVRLGLNEHYTGYQRMQIENLCSLIDLLRSDGSATPDHHHFSPLDIVGGPGGMVLEGCGYEWAEARHNFSHGVHRCTLIGSHVTHICVTCSQQRPSGVGPETDAERIQGAAEVYVRKGPEAILREEQAYQEGWAEAKADGDVEKERKYPGEYGCDLCGHHVYDYCVCGACAEKARSAGSAGTEEVLDALIGLVEHYHAPCDGCWAALGKAHAVIEANTSQGVDA